jgi:hypothetical protein
VTTPEGDEEPYGYGWWIETDVKGASARGRGGQYVYGLTDWDMILVTTGGGFEMDEIAELLLASFSDFEEPLPPNPEGVARLEAAVEAVVLPPEPTPVAPLPDMREISGKTYVFSPILQPPGARLRVRWLVMPPSDRVGGRPLGSGPGLTAYRFSSLMVDPRHSRLGSTHRPSAPGYDGTRITITAAQPHGW